MQTLSVNSFEAPTAENSCQEKLKTNYLIIAKKEIKYLSFNIRNNTPLPFHGNICKNRRVLTDKFGFTILYKPYQGNLRDTQHTKGRQTQIKFPKETLLSVYRIHHIIFNIFACLLLASCHMYY